ncbi:hypothetical protein PybrP1_002939 [[Pythium] brassicae (nom. inval.)]|nr:hypothetical protein PybrP1_002939 [[Pythium] brassicae (nom. inval.)]
MITIGSALEGLLSLSEPDDHNDRRPRLCVNLWRVPRSDGARLRTVLSAIAHILRDGRGLRHLRIRAVRTWQQLLQNPRMFLGGRAAVTGGNCVALAERLLGDEPQPRVLLDLSRTTVTKELSFALCKFFQPLAASKDCTGRSECVGARVKVDVRLAKCRLGMPELALVREMLDGAFATDRTRPRCDHQFALGELDLSDNSLGANELLVLGAMLRQNHVYLIDDVVLENVMGKSFANGGALGLYALMEAAFDVDTIARAGRRRDATHKGLASLRLQTNALNGAAFAAVCSAFRHSRAVQDLSLAGTLSLANASTREQCWRWLAFGVFAASPPRGVRPAFSVRRLDLSGNPLSFNDVEAFARALLDPVGELVWGNAAGGQHQDVEPQTGVCVVAQGAVVRQHPNSGAVQLLRVEREMELEVLCTSGQWACVLIPGFRWGWTQPVHVTLHADDGDGPGGAPESTVRFELVLNKLQNNAATIEALAFLLELVGDQLCGLELRHYHLTPDLVAVIAEYCTRLERLDLESCSLSGSEAALQRALRGNLGARLVSLNLNHTKVGFQFAETLAQVLSDRERAPPLRNLQLFNGLIGDRGLDSLQRAFLVNKMLVRLELGTAASAPSSRVELAFHSRNHNELLRVEPLSMDRRLAFLSLFSSSASAATPTRRDLDVWMLRTVLDFAASEVRRQIVWRS